MYIYIYTYLHIYTHTYTDERGGDVIEVELFKQIN